MNRTILIALLAGLIAGCTSLTGSESVVRVVEYGAGGVFSMVTGQGAGVAVHQSGKQHSFADVLIVRQTDAGSVIVKTGRFRAEEVTAAGVPADLAQRAVE